MEDIVTLDHGSGGTRTAELIETVFLPAFGDAALGELGDGAVVPMEGPMCFSTDSFVVTPCFFPGGDVGKLSVCGTVNDLAMCGGTPLYMSFSLILEEGFPMADLKRIVSSAAAAAGAAGVRVVTGDTKVVERGKGDGVYINTAGVGALRFSGLSPKNMREGDAIVLSGTAGDHGAAVMLARGELGVHGEVVSDCAALHKLAAAAAAAGARALRDPTRGGVATTLNEFVAGTGLCIELREDVPVKPAVGAACALLGLDPLYCANEGKLLAIAPPERAEEMVRALQAFPEGKDAAIIGRVSKRAPGRVVMRTALGGTRILGRLAGAQLPRIC